MNISATVRPATGWTVALAIKELPAAKSRLRELDRDDRQDLVLSMALDVMRAVRDCPRVDRWLVVTPDAQVARIAREHGAVVLAEPATRTPGTATLESVAADSGGTDSGGTDSGGTDSGGAVSGGAVSGGGGLNGAWRAARDHVTGTGAGAGPQPLALLMADLPLLTSDDLSSVLDAIPPLGTAFVADATGAGTVLLAARHAGDLQPLFGRDSARRHRLAGAVDLTARASARLRHDVDSMTELAALSPSADSATAQWLAQRYLTTS